MQSLPKVFQVGFKVADWGQNNRLARMPKAILARFQCAISEIEFDTRGAVCY